jgi:hypothetical protein
MKLRARLKLAGPIPSETIRMTFFRFGMSLLVRRVIVETKIVMAMRVKTKGTTLLRDVRRRNQCLCSPEEEEATESVSDSSSSGRERRRGAVEAAILFVSKGADADYRPNCLFDTVNMQYLRHIVKP